MKRTIILGTLAAGTAVAAAVAYANRSKLPRLNTLTRKALRIFDQKPKGTAIRGDHLRFGGLE